MINSQMKSYSYYKYGSTVDSYGERTIGATASGTIKMAINLTSESVQDNINYTDAEYLGLTYSNVDDTYVIQYSTSLRLKVLYVNDYGRLKQVFMAKM